MISNAFLQSGEVEEQPQKIHSLTDEEIAKCTRKYKLSKSQMRGKYIFTIDTTWAPGMPGTFSPPPTSKETAS